MLTKGLIANSLADFIKNQNKQKVENSDVAIDNYCKELEERVFEAIKSSSITITIPAGIINVTGFAGTVPVVCVNPSPITLTAPLTTIDIK